MKKIILLSLLGCMAAIAQAQYVTISGKVLTPQSEAAPGVTVKLIRVLDSAIQGKLTNNQGTFVFEQVARGRYKIHFEQVGFAGNVKDLVARESMDLGEIQLSETTYDLDAVTIEGEQAAAQQLGDTTQFNASAYKTNPDATAQDLMEKLPGVVVQNGQVQAQGENVQQVLVDGRQFFGNDPNAALSNLPAEIVDKIQVFDQQSEQAQLTGVEDGQTTKTINIVTKVEFRNGTFGKGYAGFGEGTENSNRYKAGGNLNIFKEDTRLSILGLSNNINQQNFSNEDLLGVLSSGGSRGRRGGGGRGRGGPGGFGGGRGGGNASDFQVGQQSGISETHAFGINYSDKWGKKWEVTGSYFFNLSDNDAFEDLTQQFVSSQDSGQVYEESSQSTTRNINHRFNFRISYDFDRTSSLRIIPRLTLQQNEGSSIDEGFTFRGDRTLNSSFSDFGADLTALNFSNTLVWRKRFQKRGRSLSLRLTTTLNNSLGDNQLFSEISSFGRNAAVDTINQVADLDQSGWDISSNLMYTEPLGQRGIMQFSYGFSPKYTDSRKETFSYNPELEAYIVLDTSLTNTFESRYITHQVGTGFMLRAGQGFLISRISAQFAELDNDQVFPLPDEFNYRFFNILPFAMFRLRMADQKNLRVIYRGSTSPPSVTQLQNVLDNSNPLQLSTGNPDLEQNFDNRLIIRYGGTNTEKSTVMFFLLSGQLTDNYITNSTWLPRTDTVLFGHEVSGGTQLSRPVNLSGYRNIRSLLTYGFPVKLLKSNLNMDLSYNFVQTPGLIDGVRNNSQLNNFGLGLTLSSNISENVDFTLSTRSAYNDVSNSLQTSLNQEYFQQTSSLKLNLIVNPGIVFRSRVTHQLYEGLSDGFNQNYFLWNGGIAKKFGKDNRAELELSMYDLLRQNISINRTVSDVYIQDLRTAVLQRYVMLTFTYNLRQFNMPEQPDNFGGPRPEMWDRRP